MLIHLLACTGAGPTPTETAHTAETGTTETGTTETGTTETGTTETGTPPGALEVTTTRFEGCPYPYEYPTPAELAAASPAAGVVEVDYSGPVGGCGCAGEILAFVEEPDVIRLRFDAGDCDGVFCCEVEATLSGVPSGTWTLDKLGYPPASADVTVP